MAKSKKVSAKKAAAPKKAAPKKAASAAKPLKLGGVPNQGRVPTSS
ncbi:MAG: hypothetical protein ABIR19_10545 [Ginsengibacter sp.]